MTPPVTSVASVPSVTSGAPTLRIVSINDVYTLENLPRLKTLVARYRTQSAADVFLVILAGDFLAPYVLSSLDAGRGMVDCLGDLGVTHVVLGNHEDDIAIADLRDRLRELRATCLGTNLPGFDPPLPAHDILEVGGHGARRVRVGLVGVVMSDLTVYRGAPFGGARLLDSQASALREAELLVREHGCTTVIPITHQSMTEDRALALAWTAPPLPLILGGHEHTEILTQEAGATIVKAGSDAIAATIAELTWSAVAPEAGALDVPSLTVRIEPVAGYAEDAPLRARVDAHMAKVHALEAATLMTLAKGETLSSVGVRAQQTSMGQLICSRLRDALGAEACLFNAGAIRAGRDYHGRVTYGDLKAEVPFDNEIVVLGLPGYVVRDAVASSRALAPAESGGFLQVDDRITVVEPEHRVDAVAGAPLDLLREYRVALVRNLLDGMDHIEPLARFGRERPEKVPPHGSGREVKTVLVDAFARALWDSLGGFDVVDADHDGRVTAQEISEAVARVTHEAPSSVAAGLVLRAVDQQHRGAITRDDLGGAPDKARRT